LADKKSIQEEIAELQKLIQAITQQQSDMKNNIFNKELVIQLTLELELNNAELKDVDLQASKELLQEQVFQQESVYNSYITQYQSSQNTVKHVEGKQKDHVQNNQRINQMLGQVTLTPNATCSTTQQVSIKCNTRTRPLNRKSLLR